MMERTDLETLQEAISYFKVVELEYVNSQGVLSKRQVEPLAICFVQNVWTLIAYCRLRKERREFRTDRISRLSPTALSFPPNQFSMEAYFKKKAPF
jgi:predicted DNA-binding transcriptional regulator YafY